MRKIIAEPIVIALAYFTCIFVFTFAYYMMPDTAFHHQSIQFEPASIERRRALSSDLKSALPGLTKISRVDTLK